jgi:hypothetical protein
MARRWQEVQLGPGARLAARPGRHRFGAPGGGGPAFTMATLNQRVPPCLYASCRPGRAEPAAARPGPARLQSQRVGKQGRRARGHRRDADWGLIRVSYFGIGRQAACACGALTEPSMTNGIIDSSTLYELIHLFRERRVAETSAWTWRCSSGVTCALIHGRQLGIAHTPKLALYPGLWGYIQRHLSDQVQLAAPSIQTQSQAHAITDNWAVSDEGVRLLRRSIAPAYYQAKSPYDRRSFARYQENMTVHTWPVLVGPHEIFEKHNIRAISRVLEISQRELQQVHRSSKDARMLRRFAGAHSLDDELFAILWNAYLVDLLIRGRYHDEAARLKGGQILHHPARGPILRRLSGNSTEYDVTSTM